MGGYDEVKLENIYIDRNVWERLEKYYRVDLDWHGEFGNFIEQAITEYLDKRQCSENKDG